MKKSFPRPRKKNGGGKPAGGKHRSLGAGDTMAVWKALRMLYHPVALTHFAPRVVRIFRGLIKDCDHKIDESDHNTPPSTVRDVTPISGMISLHRPRPGDSAASRSQRDDRYELVILLAQHGRSVTISLSRRRAFGEREIRFLRLLSPHLEQAYANAQLLEMLRRSASHTRGISLQQLRKAGLTGREAEVLGCMAAGKRNSEIGEILGASSRTIQKHVHRLFEKIGVETRSAATAWWFEQQA